MAKRVVVVASGETERRALPHLLAHLETDGVTLVDVRIPPRNLPLKPDMAEKLIKAAWFSSLHEPPDKFVILVDVDHGDPVSVLQPFQDTLPSRLGSIAADVLYACAHRHLEAWYFADSLALGTYLARSLGSVDLSTPDQMENPKLHLKHLLGNRVYTARVSEAIAGSLNPERIAGQSPSFAAFIAAVVNGVPLPT